MDVCLDDRRDEFIAFLKSHGMLCREFWHPIHSHKPYQQPDASFPVSTEWVPKACWLPSAFQLSSGDVEEVCKKVREFFDGV